MLVFIIGSESGVLWSFSCVFAGLFHYLSQFIEYPPAFHVKKAFSAI